MRISKFLLYSILFCTLFSTASSDDLKKFTFTDVLKFKAISGTSISEDGNYIGYCLKPDWGNTESIIQSLNDANTIRIEKGLPPKFSKDSKYAIIKVLTNSIDSQNDKKSKKTTYSLVNIKNNDIKDLKEINSPVFSNNSKWLAYFVKTDLKEAKKELKKKHKKLGQDFVIRHLESETEIKIESVIEFKFDSLSNFVFYAKSSLNPEIDGLYYRNLNKEYAPETPIQLEKDYLFANLEWSERSKKLAYLSSNLDENGTPLVSSLWEWDSKSKMIKNLIQSAKRNEMWYIPIENDLHWNEKGDRIFFGMKPESERFREEDKFKYSEENFFNLDSISSNCDLDVWHWDDPKIKTNEKVEWKSHANRRFQSCYYYSANAYIRYADSLAFSTSPAESMNYNFAEAHSPYMKLRTWEGFYHDLYFVNMKNAKNELIETKLSEPAYLSPNGAFTVFFKDSTWYVYNNIKNASMPISAEIQSNFFNEDWDIPIKAPSYGFAGWAKDEKSFLIYDKHDIWLIDFNTANAKCITGLEGKNSNIRYRIVKLDKEKKYYKNGDTLYLQGFHLKEKYQTIARLIVGKTGVETLIKTDGKANLKLKSKNADKFVYTIERYDKFPDLYITDSKFKNSKKVTDQNKQLEDYNFGHTKLIDWQNSKGDTLQGFLILPDDYKEGKKYPVLIYFYEQFSDRLHSFTMPRINHRPCFPVYASDGYVILLPDIKYYYGDPGFDASDALVSAGKKLIDMGIAKENAIGIQGHSWGGYETAFIVTETDFFKAASTGAPVGNMTSAYSGIRLESGLARQFQYESYQSRIGGNLWDSLDNYMRNSPVFHVQKVKTPLLIMFGDKDEAVPWEQGIELYLALRRAEKETVMLQYRDEPHHPKKMPNKLDYARKMKEFFDYYLKGEKAPDWWTKGIEYQGK